MTTRKLSSEKLFDFSLFKNLTRRRLSHILVAFLVTFFTVAVPIMMTFQNMDDGNVRLIYGYDSNEYAANSMRGIMALNLVFTYILAAYFGIVTLGYMMKRRSAHFYHALPERRETLYFTSIASALTCAAAGALISISIATAELFIFNIADLYPLAVTVFFKSLVTNIIAFLTTYAITVFAGTVSGNRIVQVLMSLVIMLYPIVTYVGILAMRMLNTRYFDPTPFMEESATFLSPIVHVSAYYGTNELSVPTVIIALITSALLIVLGMLIYKKRPIENSESPIVFKRLGHVLKYMFMFTITMFSGFFFYTIRVNVFSLIFGFVSGALLSFMLFNTILSKSPKAMFKGSKGLAIFAAAFAVYALVFGFDVLKLDNYIPDENNISRAEISLSVATYDDKSFDDPEILEALVNMLENQQENDKKQIAVPTEYAYSGGFTVNAVMYTKLGIPVSRTYYISKFTDGVDEFLKLYADDPRMQEEFDETLRKLEKHFGNGYTADMQFAVGNSYASAPCPFDEFLSVYTSELKKVDYDRLSQPDIGSVSIHRIYKDITGTANEPDYATDYSSIFHALPIYGDMENTIAFINDYISVGDSKHYYDTISGTVYDIRNLVPIDELDSQYISYYDYYGISPSRQEAFVDTDAYPHKEISDTVAKEILNIDYLCQRSTSLSQVFAAIDRDYVAKINYTFGQDAFEIVVVFPKGYVPSEIKTLFE